MHRCFFRCLLLSSFTLVLLYFSSSVLFSFSTLPFARKTSLRLAGEWQGLE